MPQLWGTWSQVYCKARRNHGDRQSDGNTQPPYCVYCRKSGHVKANCFILNRRNEANENGNNNYKRGIIAELKDHSYIYSTPNQNYNDNIDEMKKINDNGNDNDDAGGVANFVFDVAVATDDDNNKIPAIILDPSFNTLDAFGDGTYTASGTNATYALVSYFGRVNYAYDNKYLVQASVRRDGSSKFGQNNKYGVFPSFALVFY